VRGPSSLRYARQVPDGYRIPVHTHPKPERVTFIAGTLKLGILAEEPRKKCASSSSQRSYQPRDLKRVAHLNAV